MAIAESSVGRVAASRDLKTDCAAAEPDTAIRRQQRQATERGFHGSAQAVVQPHRRKFAAEVADRLAQSRHRSGSTPSLMTTWRELASNSRLPCCKAPITRGANGWPLAATAVIAASVSGKSRWRIAQSLQGSSRPAPSPRAPINRHRAERIATTRRSFRSILIVPARQ